MFSPSVPLPQSSTTQGSVPQRPQLLPGVGVPHDDTGVIRSGDEERRVRREVAGDHAALVALQPPDEGVGPHAPQQRLRDTAGAETVSIPEEKHLRV